MEGVNPNSNSLLYYIMFLVIVLAVVFNFFFYTRRRKIKSRRLKSISSKLKIDVNRSSVSNSNSTIIMLTVLGLFIISVTSIGLCFYIKRLIALDKDVIVFAGITFVSMLVTVYIIRFKINNVTFNIKDLRPVMFNYEISIIFSIPMFFTSIYTIIMAVAIPIAFTVSFNKILYIVIILLIYVIWLIILTMPKKANIASVQKYYQSDSVTGVIKYYESFSQQSLKADKSTKALVSVNKVFAYLFYGEYDKAETEINKFNWNEQCESLRFNKKTLLAVKNYMVGRSLDGYKYAYEARNELQNAIDKYASRHYLTVGQSEKMSDELFKIQNIITDIGQILSGSLDRISINNLTDRFEEMKNSNLPTSLLISWCLCKAHESLGEKREQAAMRQFIKEKAPNCKGLSLSDF